MKRIAVYCGASKGNNPIYVKEAYQLENIWLNKVMNSFWSGFSRYHGRYSRWRTRLRRPCNWSDA